MKLVVVKSHDASSCRADLEYKLPSSTSISLGLAEGNVNFSTPNIEMQACYI